MSRQSIVLSTVLLVCAGVPAQEAAAQFSPPPAPVYREAPPPGYRLPPSSWMTDEDDDAAAGRDGYRPLSTPGNVAPAVQAPAIARGDEVVRPPADVGARPVVPQQAAPQGAAPSTSAALPPDDQPEVGEPKRIDPQFKKQLVDYTGSEPAGTIVIDTSNKFLFLTLGTGKAIRYGIGVGREGFTWAGTERISRMAEWPDWHPPSEMIERQPYLPRFMAGGDGNPLGARALYLGKTLYRIHGTNQPSTIGTNVSSGCIRLINGDIEDLYSRVQTGTRVVVLPNAQPAATAGNSQGPVSNGPPVQLGNNTPTGTVSAAPLPAVR
jgi:lipoprotein-anchoring transpeptidase ErfK/SrfK